MEKMSLGFKKALESGGDTLKKIISHLFRDLVSCFKKTEILRNTRLNDILRWRTFAAWPETEITVWLIDIHYLHI